MKYNPKDIEKKWQKFWEKNKTFAVTEDPKKKKFYSLIEFPYPSGEGLHVGHPRPFTAMDVISRKKRMEGYNVLYPIGFDAFGLPTENYAIKTGRPPAEVTKENIANFTRQLKSLGYSFDWSRQVDTSDPKYYKWTQWLFLQFFKHGLAYKKNQPINWCPKDKIGLANEEVVNGACERCGTPTEKRNKEQWMLAITKYADKLLEGLKDVDYITPARVQQENWIGRSEGAEIEFRIKNEELRIKVFTTRPDTLFGATYMVLAPEHELVKKLESRIKNYEEAREYVERARKETDTERTATGKEKTGVELQGVKAINPANNEEIPIWIADYVLASYGTGAIMAVPAHDERDWEFAKKYSLPIKDVVAKKFGERVANAERRDGVAAVLIKDGKMLLMYDRQDKMYRLPAGGYEKNESAEQVLKRETTEETGYTDFEVVEYLGETQPNYYIEDKKTYRYRFQKGFVVRLKSEKRVAIAGEDKNKFDYYWMDFAEALKKFEMDRDCYGEEEFVRRVMVGTNCFSGDGVAINSEFLNELPTPEAKTKIISWLEEKGFGRRQVNYKLRDWVFSRQRYWGEPIPLVKCENCENKKYKYVILHGYGATSRDCFRPWLERELAQRGHAVFNLDLPSTDEPDVAEQVQFVLDNTSFDENTIIIGHSLGGVVALKLLEKIKKPVAKTVIVDSPIKADFNDCARPAVASSCDWKFNFEKIKSASREFVILGDANYPIIKAEQLRELSHRLSAPLWTIKPKERHFVGGEEPEVLRAAEETGWIPLPDSELPLKLPKVEKYQPTDTGESPLAAMEKWVNTKCPRCGGPAKRETDTMPNWAGSSWYFLRYTDPDNDKEFASMEKLQYWMGPVILSGSEGSPRKQGDSSASPQNDNARGGVDWYNGGMEHTVLHLLYSRFWNQFLYDLGLVPTREPYKKRTSHGLILGPDGEKMSKSRGNVVNPDEMVAKFGADAFRLYIMFMGPFDQPVQWDTNGLVGTKRFLERVWGLQERVIASEERAKQSPSRSANSASKIGSEDEGIAASAAANRLPRNDRTTTLLHQTIKKVADDIEAMRFNTAIAALMTLTNEMVKQEKISNIQYQVFIKLLSPFAPHIAEELWEKFGDGKPLAFSAWPQFDPELAKESIITLAIQINGKVRDEITVPAETSEEEVKKLALASEKVQKWLEGKEPKKFIYVKGKLVSIVV